MTWRESANHVFVDGDVERPGNLLSDSRAAPDGIALLDGDDRFNEFLCRPFGPGLPPAFRGEEQSVLSLAQDLVEAQKVEGFRTMAERIRRDGRTNRAHQPATMRSERRRLGARWRERLRISS